MQLSAWVLNGRCSGDIMAAVLQRLTLSAENGGEERCSPAPKLCQLIVFIPLNLSRVLNRCSSAHGRCNLSGGYKRTSALSLKRALLVLMRPSHASTCTSKQKEPRPLCSATVISLRYDPRDNRSVWWNYQALVQTSSQVNRYIVHDKPC